MSEAPAVAAVGGDARSWRWGRGRLLLVVFALVVASGAAASAEAQVGSLLSAEDGQPVDRVVPYGGAVRRC